MKKLILALCTLGIFSNVFAANIMTCDLTPALKTMSNDVIFDSVKYQDIVYLTVGEDGELVVGSFQGLDQVAIGDISQKRNTGEMRWYDKKEDVELLLDITDEQYPKGMLTFQGWYTYYVKCSSKI